jgi:hypothetical protein
MFKLIKLPFILLFRLLTTFTVVGVLCGVVIAFSFSTYSTALYGELTNRGYSTEEEILEAGSAVTNKILNDFNNSTLYPLGRKIGAGLYEVLGITDNDDYRELKKLLEE